MDQEEIKLIKINMDEILSVRPVTVLKEEIIPVTMQYIEVPKTPELKIDVSIWEKGYMLISNTAKTADFAWMVFKFVLKFSEQFAYIRDFIKQRR